MKRAGVVAVAAGSTGLFAGAARADEAPPVEVPGGAIGGDSTTTPEPVGQGIPQLQDSPVGSTIASAPVSGWTYRHCAWFDFTAEGPTSDRAWGGSGAYTANAQSLLWASVEIPAGALVREIEWYIFNVGVENVNCLGRIWRAGFGTLGVAISDVIASPNGGTITASRVVVPSSTYGPYPPGTKLGLGIRTTTTGTVQVNGVRVGFSGGGAVNMLANPVRAYDSRTTGGKLTAGATRTITLPSSLVLPGTSAIVANVTATETAAAGFLTVYAGHVGEPATSVLNFGAGQNVANGQTIGVSSSRQIKVKASAGTHVIIDVVGTIG